METAPEISFIDFRFNPYHRTGQHLQSDLQTDMDLRLLYASFNKKHLHIILDLWANAL